MDPASCSWSDLGKRLQCQEPSRRQETQTCLPSKQSRLCCVCRRSWFNPWQLPAEQGVPPEAQRSRCPSVPTGVCWWTSEYSFLQHGFLCSVKGRSRGRSPKDSVRGLVRTSGSHISRGSGWSLPPSGWERKRPRPARSGLPLSRVLGSGAAGRAEHGCFSIQGGLVHHRPAALSGREKSFLLWKRSSGQYWGPTVALSAALGKGRVEPFLPICNRDERCVPVGWTEIGEGTPAPAPFPPAAKLRAQGKPTHRDAPPQPLC